MLTAALSRNQMSYPAAHHQQSGEVRSKTGCPVIASAGQTDADVSVTTLGRYEATGMQPRRANKKSQSAASFERRREANHRACDIASETMQCPATSSAALCRKAVPAAVP